MAAEGRRPGSSVRHFVSWTFGLGRGVWLLPLDLTFKSVGIRYGWLKSLFETVPPPVLAITGQLRAERAAWRAIRRVPAYRDYLERNRSIPMVSRRRRSCVPCRRRTRRLYIDPYPIDKRCIDGRIGFRGVTMDESSGSTGTPYNWIRGAAERSVAQRNIAFFARYAFGAGDLVTLNAFSMGAWATGFNMSLGMNRHGLVKSIGPDIPKILSSLTVLGPSRRYLISGYPPFIKHLLDEGDRQGFPWSSYRMDALVGGEGMAEELRDRLLERFTMVYSGYGATDLEIGMAGESPGQCRAPAPGSRAARHPNGLFGSDQRLPMVFQYNPLVHFLEVNRLGEMLCTVSRLDLMAPRIRYNVHDSGGLLEFATAQRVLGRRASISLGSAPSVKSPGLAVHCHGRRPSHCRSCTSTGDATRRSVSWARTSTPRISRPLSTATETCPDGSSRSC